MAKDNKKQPPSEAPPASSKWLPAIVICALGALLVWFLLAEQPAEDQDGAPRWSYRVVEKYRHDPAAYTQGLLIHDGILYESTGQRGQSSLRRVDLATGIVQQQHDLDNRYFGEGLHFFRGVLIQLTWQAGEAIVYNSETFAPLRTLRYKGQGWGLTGDGDHLIMSDGSDVLRFRDAGDFSVVRELAVTDNGKKVTMLNELEWIEGEIWANVYGTSDIVVIDPTTGHVKGRLRFNGLPTREERHGGEDVLNGIAYDRRTKAVYITGKYYSNLYKIEVTRSSPKG